MCPRKLIVFKHATELGNAPAYRLFDLVAVKLRNADVPPRSFDDYEISIDRSRLPEGIEIVDNMI